MNVNNKHILPKERRKSKKIKPLFVVTVVCGSFYVLISNSLKLFGGEKNEKEVKTSLGSLTTPAQIKPIDYPACTDEQRAKIMSQLRPNRCNDKFPGYLQQCSFTLATKCPDSTWYDSNFELLRQRIKNENSSFVGVYVGCNKGYDAVNALRMGTGNPKYNKKDWRLQMKGAHDGVCAQDIIEDVPLSSNNHVIDGVVHCIEPMPQTAKSLTSAAKNLSWEQNLLVKEIAMSNTTGEIYFGVSNKTGVENRGIGNCDEYGRQFMSEERFEEECDKVSVTTLDHYMENLTTKKDEGRIHLLSIDVEGYDFNVMKGGRETLRRTEYLEFEYNWMGAWASQKLVDATKMLDEIGFTCYFAGVDNLWRLDDSCWLDHYSCRGWSNVACVNRELNKDVAQNMEDTFYKTLKKNVWY